MKRILLISAWKVDTSMQAADGEQFRNPVTALVNGYRPPSMRTILRRVMELYYILTPRVASFLSKLRVAISRTIYGKFDRNLKGSFVVTAHSVNVSLMEPQNVLLTVIDVACDVRVSLRLARALFKHLKKLVDGMLTSLLNVTSEKGSDMTAAVGLLIKLINIEVGY